MKNPLVVALLAVVFSAAAFTITLLSLSSDRPGGDAAGVSLDTIPNAELLAQIESLGEELGKLRNELAQRRFAPAPEQRKLVSEDFASRQEVEALRDELHAALGVTAPRDRVTARGEPELTPEFKSHVSKALSEVRREEREQGSQEWQESRTTRLNERLPEVARQLGLAAYQQELMRTALVGLYQSQADVKAGTGEDDPGGRTGREIWRDDLQAFLDNLGGFLSSHQLELYRNLDSDLFPGGVGGDK